MSDFKDLINTYEALAIESRLLPTEDYIWRRICREFSNAFYTPLQTVLEMDPDIVLTHVYEHRLDNLDLEENTSQILEAIYILEDPDYDIKKEKTLQKEIEEMEQKEKERLKKNEPIHPSLKKKTFNTKQTKIIETKKVLPTSGGINLSYLENMKNEK